MERKEILIEVVDYIENNLEEKLTIEEMAGEIHISQAHLQRVFRDAFGIPIAEYVRSRKLQRAMELLYGTEGKVCDIAYDVGFAYESSFIRSFKREFGITPNEARRQKVKICKMPPLEVM